MALPAERAHGRNMFNYSARAELYSGHTGPRNRKKIGYQRFPCAAEAIQFAIETLPAGLLNGAMLEVDEERFSANDIRRLYDDRGYPLQRRLLSMDQNS
jgi:hypothetical protein